MEPATSILCGAMIGLTISAPVGPMALLCIRRTLAGGFWVGLSTAAGATTVTSFYASLALLSLRGAAPVMAAYDAPRQVLTAVIMLVFAARVLWVPKVGRADPAGRSARRMVGAYCSAVAFNSLNPLGLALLLGAIAAMVGAQQPGEGEFAGLVFGVFAGSFLWWCALVGIVSRVGLRLSPRAFRVIDVGAAMAMAALGLVAIAHLVPNLLA